MADKDYSSSVNTLRDGTADTFVVAAGAGNTVNQKTVAQVIALLGISTQAVQAADYTALLATTAPQVAVTHASYGGNFFLSADQSSPALLGVRIRRTDLTYVDRAWDGKHYLLDWANLTTWSGDAGPACTAVFAAFSGSIVLHGRQGTIYDIRSRCETSDIDIAMRDISFKRMDAKHSLTTVSAASGATSFTVADGTQFAIGDLVTVSDGLSVTAANTGDSIKQITNIVGNVVTLNGGLSRVSGSTAWPVGSHIFTADAGMFLFAADEHRVTIENCIFDGNSDNNLYTCYWVHNVTISSRVKNGIISGCTFKNAPCENLFTEGNWVIHSCLAYNLYGSFAHGSDPLAVTPSSHKFIGNTIDDCNKIVSIATLSANDHNEGAITWSTTVSKVDIINCTFSNGYQRVFGDITGEDQDVSIYGCTFIDFNNICILGSGSTTGPQVLIDSCEFIRCGDIQINGTNAGQGKNLKGIKLRSCSFTGNTRIWANNQTDIVLENLRFIYDGTAFRTTLLAITASFTNNCALQFVRCDRLKAHNIYIEAPKTYTSELEYGFAMFLATNGGVLRKDSGGTNTTYYYAQNMDIDNVQIANCRYGFVMDNTLNRQWLTGVQGVRISRITVYGPPDLAHTPDATNAVGIWIAPGVIATNLMVYSMTSGNSTWQPYILLGIHSTGNVTTNRGCMVDGLWLIGPSNRGLVIGGTATNRSNYNVIVRNAFTSHGTHTNVDALHNSISTTTIDSTLIPDLTAPVAQQFYARNENTGVY